LDIGHWTLDIEKMTDIKIKIHRSHVPTWRISHSMLIKESHTEKIIGSLMRFYKNGVIYKHDIYHYKEHYMKCSLWCENGIMEV